MEKTYEKVIKVLVDEINHLEWKLARAEEEAKVANETLKAERKIREMKLGE